MDPLHEAVHDARASYKLVLEQGGGDIEVCGSLCVRACVYVCVCACKCAWLFHPTSATRTPSKQASMTKLPQDQRLLPAASIEISRSIFHLVNLSLLLCCFLCPCPVQDESPVRPATRYRQERSTHFSNLFLAFNYTLNTRGNSTPFQLIPGIHCTTQALHSLVHPILEGPVVDLQLLLCTLLFNPQ